MVRKRTRKVPLYELIADESINELISVGLSFFIIMFGINYFDLEFAWLKIIETIGEQSGVTAGEFTNELSLMFNTLINSFPLKYLYVSYDFWQAILIGIVIILVGVGLKVLLRVSKEEFMIDFGRDIYVPAIVGFASILALQIFMGILAQENPDSFTTNLDSALFIWQTYGQLILVGINAIIIGSIVRLIAKRNRSIKIKRVGNVILNGGYIAVGFYAFLRLFSLKPILNSEVGPFFKMFILTGDVSTFVVIFCIFMFTIGLELNKHGKYLLRMKRRATHRERMSRIVPQFH